MQENVALKLLNAFGVTANARWFAEMKSIGELDELMQTKIFQENPRLVLGGGASIS